MRGLLDRLVGNRSPLPFGLLLSLRSQLLDRWATTTLTVLALAASVGLATSVEMASRSVRQALEHSADALVGAAQLEIVAGDTGVPEKLVEKVRGLAEVASASPVVQQTFRVALGERKGEALRVIGIDLLYQGEARDWAILQGGFTVRDPLRLVSQPDSLIVAANLAARLGLHEGDPLLLRSLHGEHRFVVRGFLSGGLADAFGGQIAVADVFALEAMLQRQGRLSRIDVVLAPGMDPVRAQVAIAEAVGPGATVRPSAFRDAYIESILGVVRYGIWAIALMGVLLSLFLTYAVVSLSVDRRVEELALLRFAGMDARQVSILIMTEAMLVAAVGAVLGFLAAVQFGDALLRLLSQASEHLQQVEIEGLGVQRSTVAVALLLGLLIPLVASYRPAIRAGRRAPLDVLLEHRRLPPRARLSGGVALVALVSGAVALGAWASSFDSALRLPVAVVFGVVAVGCGASQLLQLSATRLERLLGSVIPRIGYLVGASLTERTLEAGATIAIWAALTGGGLALRTSVRSVAETLDAFFVGINGRQAIVILSADPLYTSRVNRELMSPETVEAVRTTPGVQEIAANYEINSIFRGEEFLLWGIPIETLARRTDLSALSTDPASTRETLLRGEALMSRAFARHFGVRVGDQVTLATREGPHDFRIGGFTREFVGRAGGLAISEATFHRFFRSDGADLIAFWTEEPARQVIDAIRARATREPLFFLDGEAWGNVVQRIVARFSGLFLLPATLLCAIGVVALVNLLVGNVIARHRDLAVIRESGGTGANVTMLVLLNGLVIGLVATLAGVALAWGWGHVMCDAITDALGWEVDYRMDAVETAVVIAVSLVASFLGAIVPATLGRPRVFSTLGMSG